jgi:CubicO group peptidase (beta-lactamase class C family)
MARIGQLVLRRGRAEDVQVIAADWIDSLAVPRNAQDGTWPPIGKVNYGFLWWLPRDLGGGMALAAGYGGQFIFVDPSRDLIIVTTAEPPFDGAIATEQENFILRNIIDFILPAVGGFRAIFAG